MPRLSKLTPNYLLAYNESPNVRLCHGADILHDSECIRLDWISSDGEHQYISINYDNLADMEVQKKIVMDLYTQKLKELPGE